MKLGRKMTPLALVSPGVKSGCFQLSIRRDELSEELEQSREQSGWLKPTAVPQMLLQLPYKPSTVQSLKWKPEQTLKSGEFFFPPGYLMQTIKGEYSSASPCHGRFRYLPPGILWTLNPIFVAVFNYYPKVLESRGGSVSAVFFSSAFPIGQKMVPSLNNLNVPTLIPTLNLSLYH